MTTVERNKATGRRRSFDRDKALHRALEVFWKRGYEPATMSELCAAMGIKPPSLYAAFGNKASLFLEAVDHYETSYWVPLWKRFDGEPDLRAAFERLLLDAAKVLSSLDAPCGCLVVLAATNVSAESRDVHDALESLRHVTRDRFRRKLQLAFDEGVISREADVEVLAGTFTTILQGMSIQARDGASRAELGRIARASTGILPG